MSQKKTKIKHPMFKYTAMHGYWDRLLEANYVPTPSGQDEKEDIMKDLENMVRETDVLKKYKFMDSALLRAVKAYSNNDAESIIWVRRTIMDCMAEQGFPGFSPLGDKARSIFDQFVSSHMTLATNGSVWEQQGKRVYVVSEALAQHLAICKLSNCPNDYIRLPYEAIYVSSPVYGLELENRAINNIYGIEDAGEHCGLFIHEGTFRDPRGRRMLRITPYGFVTGRTGKTITALNVHEYLVLPEGENFEDAYWVDLYFVKCEKPLLDPIKYLVAGLCLYLSSSKADAILAAESEEYRQWLLRLKKAKGKVQAKIKKQLSRVTDAKVSYVGGSIPLIDRHNVGGKEHQGGTHASPTMHTRGGHFRWQPYGPKNDQKLKCIYIAPQVIGVGTGKLSAEIKETKVR